MNYTNKIYARKNDNNNIVIKLFSSVFEENLNTDFLIEEGNADYHAHVHLKYQLTDEDGRYNYKISGDKLVELTEEEKKKLFPQQEPQQEQSIEEKIKELETCILELAEIVGGASNG